MLRLSVTGVADAWDSGGRLESSLIGLLLSRGRLATGPSPCCDIEIPATQTALRQLAFATSSLTELRLLETGREWKCIHPLHNGFDSIAVIAPVFAPISRSRKSFSCRCPVLQRKPEPCPHIHPRLGGTRARRRDRGLPSSAPRLRPTLQASTRASNNREDRSSTRRESGTLRVLIVPTRSVWG
jgi:hypothetical protein